MLGKEDRQISFFDTGFACSHLIDKKSFYAKMRECANKIIIDDDFADIYCLNNGRPSLPPARISKVLILETYEDLSDREALKMVPTARGKCERIWIVKKLSLSVKPPH